MNADNPVISSRSFRLRHKNYIDGTWCDSESSRRFGVQESGFGLPEAGAMGIQFFQDEKAIYVRKRDFALLP